MNSCLLIILLFILPFLILPFGVSHFEIPKVIAAQVLIEAVLILLVISQGRKIFAGIDKLQLIFVIFIFIISLIHLIFFNTEITLFGNQFRLQGIFLLWNLLALFLISSKVKLPRLPYFIYFLLLAAHFALGFLISPNDSDRWIGSLGEPNALAATAIFLWPFIYFKSSNSFLKILSFLIICLIIFFTGSRSGLVAFGIQISFIFITTILRLSLVKTTILVFVILGFAYTFPLLEKVKFYENRSDIWITSIQSGAMSPILGHGFGNIEYALPEASDKLRNLVKYQYVDSAHNIFLDWWVQAGILGVTSMLGLFIIVFVKFIKRGSELEVMLLLGILTVVSFNPASVVTLVYLWWLLGLGFKKP